jgi:hypothetical protein
MNTALRARLSAVDPAADPDQYTPELQRQITSRIVVESATASRTRRRIAPHLSVAATVLLATGLTAAVAAHSGAPRAVPAAPRAVQRLNDIAQIAAVQTGRSVDKSQYLYTRTVDAGAEFTLGADGTYTAGALPELSTRDSWSPEDPAKKGLVREGNNSPMVINPELGGPSTADLTYAQISALPTDPATLLRQVKATLPAGDQGDPDHGAFTVLLGYLEEAPPSEVAQALYRAVAMIPGVHITDDAVDVLGRRGIGLYHDENRGSIRDQYIVDPRTATYLGYDQYLIKDGVSEQHVGTGALLEAEVVDHLGERPAP